MFIAAADHNPLLPPLGEIIIGLVGFGVLCLILMKYVFPKMEATFQARREAIEGGIKRAEEAQLEAQRLLEEYRAKLDAARTEAAQIRDSARAEGQRIVDEMRVQAQDEVARIQQRGEEQLAAQRQHVVQDLRAEIGRLAVGLSERIVGESLQDSDRQARTVDRFLSELEGMAAPADAGAGSSSSGSGGSASGSKRRGKS